MQRNITVVLYLLAVCWAAHAGPVICDFENMDAWRVRGGKPQFEASTDCHGGASAIKVTMPGQVFASVQPTFPPEDWDRHVGVSFWAKGDGSKQWGSLALTGDGSNNRYQFTFYFPLMSTEWTRHEALFSEWIPEGPYQGIGQPGSLPPSGIQGLRIGSRWEITTNNSSIPSHTYLVDDVELVESVQPRAPLRDRPPLSMVTQKLRDRQPVHIVCIGDSITAGTALPDKDSERYATLLQTMLREAMAYDEIYAESRAVGGARLADARAWAAHDFQGDKPDLVTTLYGYNDKSGLWLADEFRTDYEDYLERIHEATLGSSAILPLTTLPGGGPRFVMMDDFAQVVRDMCSAQGMGFCDVAEEFKDQGRIDVMNLMADTAHPNAEGHRRIARTICDFLLWKAKTGE